MIPSVSATLVPPEDRLSKRRLDSGSTLTISKHYSETINDIPTPDVDGPRSKPDVILYLNPFITFGVPLVLISLGIALEIATRFSSARQGFQVPNVNVFGTVSGQFLASIIPTILVVPYAYTYRELDWYIRQLQPYIVLLRGYANAEESLLLDYVEPGPFLTIFRTLKYNHRVVFWSSFTAVITFAFQPLAGSIFQIRQTPEAQDRINVTNTEYIGLAPDVQQLTGFLAAAGYVQAAVLYGLGDPPFVFRNWSTAEFLPPSDPGLNATIFINTTAVVSNVNCVNPSGAVNIFPSPVSPNQFTFNSTSDHCQSQNITTLDTTISPQQYGVVNVTCDNSSETDPNFQSVMFWYFHIRDDNAPEARPVFCSPVVAPFHVSASSLIDSGTLNNCVPTVKVDISNGTDRKSVV